MGNKEQVGVIAHLLFSTRTYPVLDTISSAKGDTYLLTVLDLGDAGA